MARIWAANAISRSMEQNSSRLTLSVCNSRQALRAPSMFQGKRNALARSNVCSHSIPWDAVAAEEPIRAAGGIVVRLAGLYDFDRGPHRVFLRNETSPRRPDGLLNLLHYDDAAALCVAALARGEPGSVYLGCDDQPLTRQALVDAALESDLYDGALRCAFSGEDGPIGRRCNSAETRRLLDWRPAHSGFRAWLRSLAD